jgi:hypothetical protein
MCGYYYNDDDNNNNIVIYNIIVLCACIDQLFVVTMAFLIYEPVLL